jgi:iron complex outermembrane receptor protein
MSHQPARKLFSCASLSALCLLCLPGYSFAQTHNPTPTTAYLKTLSLEDLANIQVTSVSRTEQRVSEAAAAVHVITEEDIRRSGVRSIPEALRLAPNLQVARATARSWAIGARGFTAPFSNKLLVLIDGRSVYSPLFGGVFWDAQDTLLEDIDRIEVISGPGATMWGANAVNGIINIITKSARDTRGVIAVAGGGSEERFLTGLRYGGHHGEDLNFRVYAKYFDRAASLVDSGESARDAWHSGQAGGRLDWAYGGRDAFTLHGDIYITDGGQLEADDIRLSGGNLLGRWTRTLAATERVQLQAYYDRTHQFAPGEFGDTLNTFDLDAQYERGVGNRHQVMGGAAFRHSHDSVENLPGSIAFLPAQLDRRLFSAFLQDDVSLVADRLKLTIGSKLEHNDYTGFEVQPSVRMALTRARQALWGAVSRAVRTPSRYDRHLFFPAAPPFVFAGGAGFDSEKLVAYEAGWRVSARNSLVASVAAFFNDYDDIRSTSLGPPFVTENNLEGEIHGAELEASWQASPRWRVIGGYTVLRTHLRVKPGREDLNGGQGEAFDPEQQFQVRSSLTLPRNIEIDAWARYVGEVGSTGRGFGVVPDYLTLDARLGWSPLDNVQFAVVGQNLLDDRHREFGTREIRRAVYVKATWRHAARP